MDNSGHCLLLVRVPVRQMDCENEGAYTFCYFRHCGLMLLSFGYCDKGVIKEGSVKAI